jgi:hypothetical protein
METPLDSLASQMASAIADAEQKTVVVLDCLGPGWELNPSGQKLAGDCSSALAKSSAAFAVEVRSQLREALKRNYLAPHAIQDVNRHGISPRSPKHEPPLRGRYPLHRVFLS